MIAIIWKNLYDERGRTIWSKTNLWTKKDFTKQFKKYEKCSKTLKNYNVHARILFVNGMGSAKNVLRNTGISVSMFLHACSL